MIEQLLNFMSSRIRLIAPEEELCRQYFEPVLFPKNRIIEEEGQVPRYLYYVISGYLRLFHYNTQGDEVTTHINCPPGFLTSYTNYIQGKKSHENVECITDCELLRITRQDLDELIAGIPLFKDFSISIFQESLAYNEGRARELATLSAEQRYLKLMQEHPDILNNVPVAQIASFLGMKPESLSRIRRKILRQ